MLKAVAKEEVINLKMRYNKRERTVSVANNYLVFFLRKKAFRTNNRYEQCGVLSM